MKVYNDLVIRREDALKLVSVLLTKLWESEDKFIFVTKEDTDAGFFLLDQMKGAVDDK